MMLSDPLSEDANGWVIGYLDQKTGNVITGAVRMLLLE
jgi:hypothetical protein